MILRLGSRGGVMNKALWVFTGWFWLITPGFVNAQDSAVFLEQLAEAAMQRTELEVSYDPSYYAIKFPGGDVPADRGVCTDVVIRSYRKLGIDLQKLVHLDIKLNFSRYPNLWGLDGPDPNIDHRRVPNLMTYFSRHGQVLSKSIAPADYHPGDLVAWDLGSGIKHIGIVSSENSEQGTPLIVHNIGQGPVAEDILFNYPIIGHYRYFKGIIE